MLRMLATHVSSQWRCIYAQMTNSKPCYSDNLSCTNSDIDIVYLWCDGADPAFNLQRIETLKKFNLPWVEDNLGAHRYASDDELLYSLRSVEQNIPWINHIFIVTNNQRPPWLADHPKITVVDHREIIPPELLPTFNSTVIEMFIHKIPGLSEKFIYLNDDMYINAPLSPDFFFDGDKPIIRMKAGDEIVRPQSIEDCQRMLDDSSVSDFRKIQLRAWKIVKEKNENVDWVVCSHVADSYTKTICAVCEKKYPEMFQCNRFPFRDGTQVQQRLLVLLEMISGMGIPYQRIDKQLTFFVKHFGSFFEKTIDCFEGTACDKNRKRILRLKPKLFCLNADIKMDKGNRNKTKEFLSELFCKASSFEKTAQHH